MKGADRPKGHSQGAAGALPSSSSSSSLSLASSGPQIQSQWNGATCCLKAAAQLELAGARGLMLGAHPAPGGREPSLIWDHRMQAATGPLLSSLHSQAPPSCSFCRALGGEEEGDGGGLEPCPGLSSLCWNSPSSWPPVQSFSLSCSADSCITLPGTGSA